MDCPENNPKPAPEARFWNHFWLIESLGLQLRPELPRAVAFTAERDGVYYLAGLLFETAEDAARFADGIAEHCHCDGLKLFFTRLWPATIH